MGRRGVKPARIEVNIEEFVLHGFSPADRYGIGEAVQQELARLLAERGLPSGLAKGGDADRLDGGEIRMIRGAKARAVGENIGRAIYEGMR